MSMSISISTTSKTLSIPTNFNNFPSPKPHFNLSFPPNSLPSSLLHHPTNKPSKHLSPLFASPPPHDPSGSQLDYPTLTREAVSEFLLQLGVPNVEVAASISSNSRKYVQMLMDSVLELEELGSWKGDDNGEEGFAGFKERVIRLAKEKGDNGKVAFLESIGLSLSSAFSVARYLSAEPLPALIDKVNYMKEIFFSGGSDGEGLVGKNARRIMRHLSIPVDDDVQQTLAFFEKIEARRGGLDMLVSADASFRYLVESFPRLLLLSVESNLKPMVQFLENIGVDRRRMGNIFLLYPPMMFCDIKDVRRKVFAFEEVGAMDKDVGKMLLKYPWILSTSIQENYKEILLYFHEEKVPKLRVDRAIRRWPHILGCSTGKLKLMVEAIGELGVRNKKLGQVIAKSPQLLLRKPQDFLEVVSFVEDLGFNNENVGKILARCPELFSASIEKTLNKKVGFLYSIGVSKDHLPRVINKYPELLVSDIDRTLLPRMSYLMEIGLSKRDIVFMVRRFSPLLGYSIDEVLQPKVDFLVNTMDKPLKEVVDYPRYFSYSLEKKIKPRFWVLKGRNVECSLKDMLGKNDEEFAAEFMNV